MSKLPIDILEAVLVTQLAERTLPKPEICGSNPNIGKNILKRQLV